ncbi:MAG: hypothetical protein ACE5GR_07075 [Nitrosopumilus sp.]
MTLQTKMTVYAAVAGVLAMLGGIVYYASLDNAHLEQAEIELASVELKDVNTINNQATFDVTFLVKNPSEKTFTVAQIGYQIYNDDKLLGSGQYSTADIALPGRAVFYPGAEVPLKSTFTINKSEVSAEIYQAAIEDKISSFMAEGIITTETSWSIVEKEFKTELN